MIYWPVICIRMYLRYYIEFVGCQETVSLWMEGVCMPV